ncbi:helix-turn-helix domain-containing protein [Ihubacter massiliensis]|uniref:helix-turn-helix domain-containing protein n=1 Tax=Ihubacter massiliensis TaxID=1852367 RepID=UPI002097A0F7|nr:helix-turn-helix domain-containing protein [Ihubacter massiliensis]MCI7301480.1 helix-turn-helix domain-containing protein [Clostridia bacterium]MCO7120562.1 helix-turn-helix domain-containing protein [Ihubacter massiliensis]MDY3010631.1 helix-turn-helix domain-containing protein [Clostridiales Family XIII bacterium]
MSVSKTLRHRRKELDYTLLDIAKMVGVSEATVQRWESGNIKNLRYDKIIALSNALNVSPSCLMGWDDVSTLPTPSNQVADLLSKLNDDGKEKVLEYAEDLIASGKYARDPGDEALDEIREKLKTDKRAL